MRSLSSDTRSLVSTISQRKPLSPQGKSKDKVQEEIENQRMDEFYENSSLNLPKIQILNSKGKAVDMSQSKLYKSEATISINGLLGGQSNYKVQKFENVIRIIEVEDEDKEEEEKKTPAKTIRALRFNKEELELKSTGSTRRSKFQEKYLPYYQASLSKIYSSKKQVTRKTVNHNYTEDTEIEPTEMQQVFGKKDHQQYVTNFKSIKEELENIYGDKTIFNQKTSNNQKPKITGKGISLEEVAVLDHFLMSKSFYEAFISKTTHEIVIQGIILQFSSRGRYTKQQLMNFAIKDQNPLIIYEPKVQEMQTEKQHGKFMMKRHIDKKNDEFLLKNRGKISDAQAQKNIKIQTFLEKYKTMNEESIVLDFIKSFSKYFSQSIINLKILAQGGEAVVYRMQTIDEQELVAKCTLFDEKSKEPEKIHNAFLSILKESQTLKLLNNPKCIPIVREEIYILDQHTKLLQKYVVVVEKAQSDLHQMMKIWQDPVESKNRNEFYSPQKLLYIFMRIMYAMKFLHSSGIYYGDMKPQNLLIFKNYDVKIGDFGVTIIKNPKKSDDLPLYVLQGLTPSYCFPETIGQLQSRARLSFNQLVSIDKTALYLTFNKCDSELQELNDKYFKGNPLIYRKIRDDLASELSISQIFEKWEQNLKSSHQNQIYEFGISLAKERKISLALNILTAYQCNEVFSPSFQWFRKPITQDYLDKIPQMTPAQVIDDRFNKLDLIIATSTLLSGDKNYQIPQLTQQNEAIIKEQGFSCLDLRYYRYLDALSKIQNGEYCRELNDFYLRLLQNFEIFFKDQENNFTSLQMRNEAMRKILTTPDKNLNNFREFLENLKQIQQSMAKDNQNSELILKIIELEKLQNLLFSEYNSISDLKLDENYLNQSVSAQRLEVVQIVLNILALEYMNNNQSMLNYEKYVKLFETVYHNDLYMSSGHAQFYSSCFNFVPQLYEPFYTLSKAYCFYRDNNFEEAFALVDNYYENIHEHSQHFRRIKQRILYFRAKVTQRILFKIEVHEETSYAFDYLHDRLKNDAHLYLKKFNTLKGFFLCFNYLIKYQPQKLTSEFYNSILRVSENPLSYDVTRQLAEYYRQHSQEVFYQSGFMDKKDLQNLFKNKETFLGNVKYPHFEILILINNLVTFCSNQKLTHLLQFDDLFIKSNDITQEKLENDFELLKQAVLANINFAFQEPSTDRIQDRDGGAYIYEFKYNRTFDIILQLQRSFNFQHPKFDSQIQIFEEFIETQIKPGEVTQLKNLTRTYKKQYSLLVDSQVQPLRFYKIFEKTRGLGKTFTFLLTDRGKTLAIYNSKSLLRRSCKDVNAFYLVHNHNNKHNDIVRQKFSLKDDYIGWNSDELEINMNFEGRFRISPQPEERFSVIAYKIYSASNKIQRRLQMRDQFAQMVSKELTDEKESFLLNKCTELKGMKFASWISEHRLKDGFQDQAVPKLKENLIIFFLSETGDIFGLLKIGKYDLLFSLTKKQLLFKKAGADSVSLDFSKQYGSKILIGKSDLVVMFDWSTGKSNFSQLGNQYSLPPGIEKGTQEANSYLAGKEKFRIEEFMIFTSYK